MCSPSDILHKSTLFKYTQHALVHPRPHLSRVFLPLRLAYYWVGFLVGPSRCRSLTTGKHMLMSYALPTDKWSGPW